VNKLNKAAMDAFTKLQKQEHMIRVARDRKACGRITPAQYREEEKAIMQRFALTQDEERAYEYETKVSAQRKRG
jgi:hypothetical protein